MEQQNQIFDTLLSIKASEMDLDALISYSLSLSISAENLKVCVYNEQRKCLALEHYRFYEQITPKLLQGLFENHLFLRANYWKNISLHFTNQIFTIVPNAFYEEDFLIKYLKPTIQLPAQSIIYVNALPQIQAQNIFAVSTELYSWFADRTYPNKSLQVTHQVTNLIKLLSPLAKSQTSDRIFAIADSKLLALVVFKQGELIFCNVFSYKTPQDFIYYVLFVLQELKIERVQATVELIGEVSPKSQPFELLKPYLKEVLCLQHFDKRITLPFDFDSIELYQYIDFLVSIPD
ncbi:MAG TPA: hypothetical protein DCM08_06795 [Microscillaceae bacterium]|nr:hypothetical protein [Microscillaceae bacterium]